jgi:predicted dehydrogenase
MPDQILKVGIIGTGIFATDQHLPTFKSLSNHFEPVAAFNRTKAKAEKFAKVAGISDDHVHDTVESIIKDEDVDFLDALLPVQYNFETIQKAVDNKKPIIVEKPIAHNLEDARKIVQLDRSTDIPIAIAEQWIYFKAVDLLKEKLEKIGSVISFTYRSTGPYNPSNKYLATTWRQKPEHIGGFLSDGGVHQLALLTSVLGPIKSISALTKQVRETSGDVDTLFSTARLESDAIGTFTYGSAFGATEKHGSFIIYGTNGSVTFEFSAGKPRSIKTLVGSSNQDIKDEEYIEFDEVDGVSAEFENFYESVTKKDKSLIRAKPETAFHHLAVIAAAIESASKNGDSITVEKP